MLSCNIILTQGFKIVGQLLMNSDVLRVERIALFLALESFRPRMPIGATLVYRIITGIGIPIRPDAGSSGSQSSGVMKRDSSGS